MRRCSVSASTLKSSKQSGTAGNLNVAKAETVLAGIAGHNNISNHYKATDRAMDLFAGSDHTDTAHEYGQGRDHIRRFYVSL